MTTEEIKHGTCRVPGDNVQAAEDGEEDVGCKHVLLHASVDLHTKNGSMLKKALSLQAT